MNDPWKFVEKEVKWTNRKSLPAKVVGVSVATGISFLDFAALYEMVKDRDDEESDYTLYTVARGGAIFVAIAASVLASYKITNWSITKFIRFFSVMHLIRNQDRLPKELQPFFEKVSKKYKNKGLRYLAFNSNSIFKMVEAAVRVHRSK